MTDKCAYVKCGKDLVHIEGRKKKKYCNPTCKMNAWKAANPAKKPKFKMIPVEEYEKMKKTTVEPKKVAEKVEIPVNKDIQAKIAEIKSRKKPTWADNAAWNKQIQKEIDELTKE